MVAVAGVSAATDPSGERRRVAGGRTSLVGAGLLCAFGLAVLVAGLVSGQPVEASFLLFALGLLLIAVGQTMLALAVRRTGALGRWWLALLVAAAGALAAVLVFSDPWHDLALFTFDAAWFALGAHVLRDSRRGSGLGERDLRVGQPVDVDPAAGQHEAPPRPRSRPRR